MFFFEVHIPVIDWALLHVMECGTLKNLIHALSSILGVKKVVLTWFDFDFVYFQGGFDFQLFDFSLRKF